MGHRAAGGGAWEKYRVEQRMSVIYGREINKEEFAGTSVNLYLTQIQFPIIFNYC